MSRKNKHITDLKYNTKRRIASMRRSVEALSIQWSEVDFMIEQEFEQLLNKLDEITEEVEGVDVKTH
jgi:hypothetical protein